MEGSLGGLREIVVVIMMMVMEMMIVIIWITKVVLMGGRVEQ